MYGGYIIVFAILIISPCAGWFFFRAAKIAFKENKLTILPLWSKTPLKVSDTTAKIGGIIYILWAIIAIAPLVGVVIGLILGILEIIVGIITKIL